jgi:aminoglycoside 6-adenylyltransferase
MLNFDDLIERITAWAKAQPDVRAALILGSRARTDHPADEWSDLDVLVFAHQPDQFIQSAEWAKAIAPAWLSFPERTGDGQSWERRTLYAGGLDVDVAVNPVEWLDAIQAEIPPVMADIIRRGVRILVDKDGKLRHILSLSLPQASLFEKPNEQAFINATSDFWYHTLWSAKHLRRGELWWAKSGVDMHLKWLLQQMLEWHAQALRGDGYDTWLRGRFLEEWADPRAVEQLKASFAHYDAKDIASALSTTMHLYRWLEDETAAKWGYSLPLEGERQAAHATYLLLKEYGVKNTLEMNSPEATV